MTPPSTYASPIPPLTEPARTARTGGYDRFGNPQDTVHDLQAAPVVAARPMPYPRGIARPRSVLLAVFLAALLGPIGLLYSSRVGALVTSTFFLLIALPVVPFWPEWVFVAAVPVYVLSVMWAFFATLGRNAAIAFQHRWTVHSMTRPTGRR